MSLNRRALLQGIPSGLASATVVGYAAQASDLLLPPVLSAAEDPLPCGEMDRALVAGARCIEVLLKKAAPQRAWIKGYSFRCVGGELDPESIWATIQLENYELAHARPAVFGGWRWAGKNL
jgi:hypothetical protein